jgi:cell pole-organizing protein PopZ
MDEPTLADGDNTDEIIGAIRRIMATDEEVLTSEEGTGRFSKEARERIFAALDRLTGGEEKPPTLLEELVLERLEPLLQDWLDRNLPPLVEGLMREEIRGLLEAAVSSTAPANDTKEDTPPEMAIEDAP